MRKLIAFEVASSDGDLFYRIEVIDPGLQTYNVGGLLIEDLLRQFSARGFWKVTRVEQVTEPHEVRTAL